MPELISFVIPAHNEEEYVGKTINAINVAMLGIEVKYDITVVNDASIDKTRTVAIGHGAEIVDIDLRQIAGARNHGANLTDGDVIIWVDADTLVNASLLKGVLEVLEQGAIGGGSRLEFDSPAPLWGHMTAGFCGWIFSKLKLAAGSFVFCTREVFEQSGGFNEQLFASEEIDFSRRLKKLGTFVIVQEKVMTSARKLRDYSFCEIWFRFFKIMLLPGSLKSRDQLDLWYKRRG
jgi:glycosyltransferase involved in cell wall biosynthesis